MLDFIPIVAAEGSGSLDALKTVFSWVSGCIGDIVNTIATTPLLLLPVGIFAFGACIGLSKRFIGR